jgi:SAM-dependent methyltransferase
MKHGLTSILTSPSVYVLYQRLVGGARMRRLALESLAPRRGERILDVGCGPAYYLDDLGDVDYHGFDTSRTYIDHARRRFGTKAQFHCEPFGEEHLGLGPFDGVMLMGLLHHLDDEECGRLLELLGRTLAAGGRVVALDAVLYEGQSWLEHQIASRDRGEYVRSPDGFRELGERWFESVEGRLLSDRWYVPSIYYLMILQSPRSPTTRSAEG